MWQLELARRLNANVGVGSDPTYQCVCDRVSDSETESDSESECDSESESESGGVYRERVDWVVDQYELIKFHYYRLFTGGLEWIDLPWGAGVSGRGKMTEFVELDDYDDMDFVAVWSQS